MEINVANVTHPSMPSRTELETEAKKAENLAQSQPVGIQQTEGVNPAQVVDRVNKAQQTDIDSEREQEEDKEALEAVVEELSDVMKLMNKDLAFSVDEDSGTAVVKVMDIDSGELIRQIPSDEALELAQKLQDVKGLLMRTEA